jgi:hypothetical protein
VPSIVAESRRQSEEDNVVSPKALAANAALQESPRMQTIPSTDEMEGKGEDGGASAMGGGDGGGDGAGRGALATRFSSAGNKMEDISPKMARGDQHDTLSTDGDEITSAATPTPPPPADDIEDEDQTDEDEEYYDHTDEDEAYYDGRDRDVVPNGEPVGVALAGMLRISLEEAADLLSEAVGDVDTAANIYLRRTGVEENDGEKGDGTKVSLFAYMETKEETAPPQDDKTNGRASVTLAQPSCNAEGQPLEGNDFNRAEDGLDEVDAEVTQTQAALLLKRKKEAYRERVLGAILQCPPFDSTMERGLPFDCGTLSPYDYHVEEGVEYVNDPNAAKAVAKALETIRNIGGVGRGPELVALHTTGDGHCLVHAVSRALVGAELYYRYVCVLR